MFLLNHVKVEYIRVSRQDLHPIMFLLNLNSSTDKSKLFKFTSHYVPIKSMYDEVEVISHVKDLHPIMFLLNLL